MRPVLLSITLALPAALSAEPLKIVTDIAPIHSLVSQIAGPDAEITLLVQGTASPHNFQFTFDQAAALQDADLVIWTGNGISPWLTDALANVAPDTPTLSLLETDGWPKLELRTDPAFADAHDHDHDHDHDHGDHDDHDDHADHADADHEDHGHEDHAEKDHDDHDHGEHEDHADADHVDHGDHDGHDDHGHDDHDDHAGHDDHDDHASDGVTDPHAWLSPGVAKVWLGHIGETLAAQDTENAAVYAANTDIAQGAMDVLSTDIETILAGISDPALLVPHDAYQYFGDRYGVRALGAISLSDATAPSPDEVQDLQAMVRNTPITCILSDPQSRPEWITLVNEQSDARTALADPLGTTIEPGPAHYDATLRAVAQAYADCLAPQQ